MVSCEVCDSEYTIIRHSTTGVYHYFCARHDVTLTNEDDICQSVEWQKKEEHKRAEIVSRLPTKIYCGVCGQEILAPNVHLRCKNTKVHRHPNVYNGQADIQNRFADFDQGRQWDTQEVTRLRAEYSNYGATIYDGVGIVNVERIIHVWTAA